MIKLLSFTAVLLTLAFAADPPKLAELPKSEQKLQTFEQLQAENAKLKEQIAAMQKAFVLEMRIRDGALQACREAALQPPEKPKPQVP